MADPAVVAFLLKEWNQCILDKTVVYYKASKNTRRRIKKKARLSDNRDCEILLEYISHTWSLHCSGLPADIAQARGLSHNVPHYKGFLPLDHLLDYIGSEDNR